jgi:hypothetical protein
VMFSASKMQACEPKAREQCTYLRCQGCVTASYVMARSSIAHPVHHDSAPPPESEQRRPERRHKVRKKVRNIWQIAPMWMHVSIVAAGALLAVAAVFISANWPYRGRKIRPMLEDMLASQVSFTSYHRTYWPNPGFVATGITMRRKSALNLPPLGHIDTLVVEGRWPDLLLLQRRVQLVDITGFHVVVPAIGSKENRQDFPPGSSKDFDGPQTMIERLMMHKSLLEIMRTNGERYSFPLKQLEIRNVHHGEAMTWAVDMENAIPHGRILARGSMGPIKGAKFINTPVSGNFAFTEVKLQDVGEIGGVLNSRGVFKGTLQSMDVEASAITKNFTVTDGKPTPIEGTIQTTLHASNGELEVRSIDLKVRETGVHAVGTINGKHNATNLDIAVDHGRAEDLMRPFVHDEVPIRGRVTLTTHAYLGPPGNGFMERLRMAGELKVPAEKVTDEKTEKNLSAFSERAQGKEKNTGLETGPKAPPPGTDVVSSLDGPVRVQNGVVSTPHVTFRVPGAEATLAGTFRFHDQAVHMTGKLKMDTDISHTAKGFKSFLLKPLAPFFKKKNAGAMIPIAVTGLPGHHHISQNIAHDK